jgi:hypothetical protein
MGAGRNSGRRDGEADMRRILYVLLATLCTATLVQGQTNDHVYRSWRWEEDPGSPRAAGLAGSFTAIADDASASLTNPAGLADLPRTEAMGSLLRRGSGTIGPGDALGSSTNLGLVGGTVAIGSRLGLGVHFSEPRDIKLNLAPNALPDSTLDSGFLQARLRTLGVAAGYQVTSHLRIGAGIARAHLELDSQDSVLRPRGDSPLTTMDATGADSAIIATFGALYDITPDVRVGLSAHTGGSFQVSRTAFSPVENRTLDQGSVYELREPDVFSAGVAWRLPASFRVTAQADLVRYSQIRDALDIRRDLVPSDYVLDDGVEGHIGLEWARIFNPLTLQLRGGLWSQAPGSVEYVGPDLSERMTFQGSSRRLREGFGASVLLKDRVSFDTAILLGGDRTVLMGAARYRF